MIIIVIFFGFCYRRTMHKVTVPTGTASTFDTYRLALRAKYPEPRTSTAGGIYREWYELENGQVIMLASPLKEEDHGNSTSDV